MPLFRSVSQSLMLGILLFGIHPADADQPFKQVAPVPATFFGMHIHHAETTTPWPEVPFAEWRLWDAHVDWPSLEPQSGQWRFNTLDKDVELASRHGVNLLLPLGLSPRWASARPNERSAYQPGNAAEPRNIADWRDFVKTVATRYRGRIHEYEIWNEPNSKSFWTGTVGQMIDLTREASQIIHAIDPSATIVSPAATTLNGVPWLAQFLAAGGGQYVDVIGYHFYVTPQPPEMMQPLIRRVMLTMKENGAGNKPLWDTETGWSGPKPFPTPALAASYLARAHLLAWTSGVQRLYWYAWDNHAWVSLETTESDNHTLTLAGKAYGIVHEWMAGAQIDACSEAPNQIWICGMERDGAKQWIVWSPDGAKIFLPAPDLHITMVTPMFGESRHVLKGSLEINQIPALLTSAE